MMSFRFLRSALVTVLSQLSGSWACSVVAVGKDASENGHPMVSHTEDMGPAPHDIRLVRVPRQTHAPGSMRPIYRWQENYPRVRSSALSPEYAPVGDQQEEVPFASIPQVPETFAYWDTDYGVQNEMGLSIGESTCNGRTVGFPAGQPGGYNHIGIEDLSKLALERCSSARCAVETMGKIAVDLGFYSADSGTVDKPDYIDSAEALVLVDATPGDVWIFNVLTGNNNASAIWAAQRVPSDHVAVVANAFSIGKMNLSDSATFLYSPGVTELAQEMGWWSPKSEASADIFDFFGSYGYTPPDEANRNVGAYYSGRRMWRVYSLWAEGGSALDPNTANLPSTSADERLPASMPVKKGSVTLNMVFDVLRDHYEGTPYDLTQGMAAGPFGTPNRGPGELGVTGQWERAFSLYRTAWSFVLQARPNSRSITWFGWDAPHGTAYLPFYAASVRGAPDSYTRHDAHMSKFSTDAAWWAFNFVNQYTDLNFRVINAEVRAKSSQIEAEAARQVVKWEAEADRIAQEADKWEPAGKPKASLAYLTEASNAFAEDVVKQWWEFAWFLVGKYRGYEVTFNESLSIGGDYRYPAWWMRSPEVGYSTWTPAGPFHGVVLDESLKTLLPATSSNLPSSFVGSMGGTAGYVCTTVMITVAVGVVSYRAGIKEGRSKFDVESFYIAQ